MTDSHHPHGTRSVGTIMAPAETRKLIRINKYLSICGVTSRRGAEQLIKDRRVTVNAVALEQPGIMIDDESDIVKVDGVIVSPVRRLVYVLLNKPRMVLTTLHDPFKRKTVAQLLRRLSARVYPVGRLDYDTEGVLILTNDGELAFRLAHPKYEIKKVYVAIVAGAFTADHIDKIKKGIKLEDGHIGKAAVEILSSNMRSSTVQLTLIEGHKREVKQLLKAVGHTVRELRRVEFAGLRANDLKLGHWRHLNYLEIRALKDMVGL